MWLSGVVGEISRPAYFPARRSRNQSSLTRKDVVLPPPPLIRKLCAAGLDNYIEKSIVFAKIFRLRVCSVCHQSAAFGV